MKGYMFLMTGLVVVSFGHTGVDPCSLWGRKLGLAAYVMGTCT